MADPRLDLLLRNLHQAFDRRSWHGTNLLGSIRRLGPEEAAWRPQPERHNAWEIAVHAAYWKYRVYRLVTDAPPRSFSLPGSDWFERPTNEDGATTDAWKRDVALLREWHGLLTGAVERFDPARLGDPATDKWDHFDLIAGAAAHDLYHCGQIQLIRRMRGR